jgi:hypothetical protein
MVKATGDAEFDPLWVGYEHAVSGFGDQLR